MKTTPAIITLDALDLEADVKLAWHPNGGYQLTLPVNDDTVLELRLSATQAERLWTRFGEVLGD